MATKTKAQLYLEEIQKRYYSQIDNNFNYEEIVDQMVKNSAGLIKPTEQAKFRDNLKALIEESVAAMPTPFEDPFRYQIIVDLSRKIENSAKKLSRPIPSRPLIGTLPTGRVNAMAIAVPQSQDYIIVFETELFTFALLLSKVIVYAMPFEGEQGEQVTVSVDIDVVKKRITENKDIIQRFYQVVTAYILLGRPSAAPPYLLNGQYMSVTTILLRSMELFVMGHEYGHIINGHLVHKKVFTSALGGENVEEIALNWQQEFEADATGLELMLNAMHEDRMDLSLSFWGADFFFSCIEIIERSLSLIRTGKLENSSVGSHPPAKLRRQALRTLLKQSLPENMAEGPIELGETLEKIMDIFWEEIRPALYKLHKEGKQVAPIWD